MKNIIIFFAAVILFGGGCSGHGGTESAPALEAPSEVTAEIIDNTRIKVSWKDNCERESGFSVWMKQNETDNPERVGFTARNAQEYTAVYGIEHDQTYYFGVRADGGGDYDNSGIVYAPGLYFEDLTLPGVTFTGTPLATQSCIAFEYTLRNLDNAGAATWGICWSADGLPVVGSAHQAGPALPENGKMMQVISNVLLDYGREYRFRAYLQSGKEVYYSAELRSTLGTEPQPIVMNWTKLETGSLPETISVFKTTDKLSGHNFNAWYAIADVSGDVELRVSVPSSLATIDQQSASFSGDCYVMTNAGYFYNTDHVGLAVSNSYMGYVPDVRGSLRTGDAEYSEMYHVTRGIFGVDASGKPAVYWAGTSDASHYYFNRPLPSVRGEAKYGKVSLVNPASNASWQPKYAISAGPVLLKDGKCPFDFTETGKGTEYYLNNYEIIPYDIFGPSVSPDRTAVGCTADGKVVLFVCDGRIASSGGATLTELAMIMKGLGCVEAINLDGGGSTGMMVSGQHVNYHADGNRAVKSTIGFFKK